MTMRHVALDPSDAEPVRCGRPSKAAMQAQAQARQAIVLLAGLDTLTVSSQGRVSAARQRCQCRSCVDRPIVDVQRD